MEIRNNITADLIKRHLKREEEERRKQTVSTASNYSRSNFVINFYEWSNLDGTPKAFTSYFEFFRFCESCHITVTNETRQGMYETFGAIYTTCKNGKAELLYSGTYIGLKNLLKYN